MVSSAYLKLLFLPSILIPACDLPRSEFYMMYSAQKLNKQGDNKQPCLTIFPILNWSVVSCPFLTIASWSLWRSLRRQVRQSGIPISCGTSYSFFFCFCFFFFLVINTVKGFSVVNEAEVDVFLEFPCLLYDPPDVGNMTWFLDFF